MTTIWFFLSTLNYDARSTTHQIYKHLIVASCWFSFSSHCADEVTPLLIAMKFGHLIEVFSSGLEIGTPIRKYGITSFTFIMETRSWVGPNRSNVGFADTPCRPTHCCCDDAVCTTAILTALSTGAMRNWSQ